ncbi:MAG: amidohydrolase [Chitinophagaceae bacterium]
MSPADLKVSLIQSDLAWEAPDTNLRRLEEKIAALSGKSHIAILPETFTTGFSMNAPELAEEMDGPGVRWMQDCAHRYRIIITGSMIIRDGGHYHNRLIWALPNGSRYCYDKRHLFSYAGEDVDFSPGTKRLIVQVNGWKICPMICYDLRFPVWARNTDGYDVLLYIANWPERRNEAWETLLKARAIENQSIVIGVNRVGTDGKGHRYIGNSSIYGPLGELLAKADQADECVVHYTLQHSVIADTRAQLPFLKDMDRFSLL